MGSSCICIDHCHPNRVSLLPLATGLSSMTTIKLVFVCVKLVFVAASHSGCCIGPLDATCMSGAASLQEHGLCHLLPLRKSGMQACLQAHDACTTVLFTLCRHSWPKELPSALTRASSKAHDLCLKILFCELHLLTKLSKKMMRPAAASAISDGTTVIAYTVSQISVATTATTIISVTPPPPPSVISPPPPSQSYHHHHHLSHITTTTTISVTLSPPPPPPQSYHHHHLSHITTTISVTPPPPPPSQSYRHHHHHYLSHIITTTTILVILPPPSQLYHPHHHLSHITPTTISFTTHIATISVI